LKDQKQTTSDRPVLPELEILRFDSYEDLYESITVDGSLGILALGAVGVMVWRQKRMEAGWKPPVPDIKKKKPNG
jgi:hypothetical protein